MILHCSHFMELHNIANHGIVLGGVTLYHMSLHCIAWFARLSMVLYGIALYVKVLLGIALYCMVLPGIALNSIILHWILHSFVYCTH